MLVRSRGVERKKKIQVWTQGIKMYRTKKEAEFIKSES